MSPWAGRAGESGGKHAAVQTLARHAIVPANAQRLECGGFSTALVRTRFFIRLRDPRAGESGVASALCQRTP